MTDLHPRAAAGVFLLALLLPVAACAPNQIYSKAQSRDESISGVLVINSAFGQADFAQGLKGEFGKCGVGVTVIPNDDVHGKDKAVVADLLKRRGTAAGASHLLEIYWSSSHRTVGSSAGSRNYTLAMTRLADGGPVWSATDTIYSGLLRQSPNFGDVAADIVGRIKADGVLTCG